MLHNVSIRTGKRILLNLLIFLCLFSQSALITDAQINSNPQGSFEVEIGGSVGSISATPVTKNSWWGILIPIGTQPGTYSGVNTITAVKGETANW